MPKDVTVTVTVKPPVGFRYTGGGAFFEGLPTRDLTPAEIPQALAPVMLRAIELGLYEPIYEDTADAQSD